MDKEIHEDKDHNGWCEENEHHRPSRRYTHCEEEAVAVTLMPLQQITSKENRTLDRAEAYKSEAVRCVDQRSQYNLTGAIARHQYECVSGCDSTGTVFDKCGYGEESF
jgi:hypothetical protein